MLSLYHNTIIGSNQVISLQGRFIKLTYPGGEGPLSEVISLFGRFTSFRGNTPVLSVYQVNISGH